MRNLEFDGKEFQLIIDSLNFLWKQTESSKAKELLERLQKDDSNNGDHEAKNSRFQLKLFES